MSIRNNSKKTFASLGSLAVVAGLLGGLTTGGMAKAADLRTAPATGKQNIVFLAHITPNLTMKFWQTEVKIFEKKNPNIQVKVIPDPTTNIDQYAKTLLASGQFPDVQYNLDVSNYVSDGVLMPFPIDSQIKQINHYKAELYNGKLYDLGPVLQPQNLIFYNKLLFAKAGIKNPPKTSRQFDQDCKKLKAAGITPLLTSGDWAVNQIFTAYLTSVTAKDPSWVKKLNEGKVHFTDKNVMVDVNHYANAVKNGYFNKGDMSLQYPQLESIFLSQKTAMYPMGIWFTASPLLAKSKIKKDIGVFVMPTNDGKIHMLATIDEPGFSVYSKTKYPAASMKLAKFFAFDPTVNRTLLQADGLISDLKKPIIYPMTPLQKQIFKLTEHASTVTGSIDLNFGDNAPVAGAQAEVSQIAQNIFNGESTLQVMQQLDTWWGQQVSGN